MNKKIIKGIGANGYSQLVNILIQILSVPIFLWCWPAEKYGVWIMLIAIPSYLSMSDLGLLNVASNKMNMLAAKGEWLEANGIFKSLQMLMFTIFIVATLLGGLIIGISTLVGISNLVYLLTVIVLGLNVILILSGNIIQAYYRSADMYEKGVYWDVNSRLAEWLSMIFMVCFTDNYLFVALAMLAARTMFFIFGVVSTRNTDCSLDWGIGGARFLTIKPLVSKSLSFSFLPFANALNLQGFSIIVGLTSGPLTLVVFNTYRTVARMAIQFVSILTHSVWPQFSRLYGAGDLFGAKVLYRNTFKLSCILAFIMSLAAVVFYIFILEYWTAGDVLFDQEMAVLFFIYSLLGGLWHLSRVFLIATNRHANIAFIFLFLNICFVSVAYLCQFDYVEVLYCMIVIEFLSIIFSIILVENIFKEKL